MYVLISRELCYLFDSVPSAPTAGGQYHWVAMLAPPSSKKFLSYITGDMKIYL
jgi:choline transport protein